MQCLPHPLSSHLHHSILLLFDFSPSHMKLLHMECNLNFHKHNNQEEEDDTFLFLLPSPFYAVGDRVEETKWEGRRRCRWWYRVVEFTAVNEDEEEVVCRDWFPSLLHRRHDNNNHSIWCYWNRRRRGRKKTQRYSCTNNKRQMNRWDKLVSEGVQE